MLGQKKEMRAATIHVWVSMTGIIDYVVARGGSESLAAKDSSVEPSSAAISKHARMLVKAKNPLVININANGEFLELQ